MGEKKGLLPPSRPLEGKRIPVLGGRGKKRGTWGTEDSSPLLLSSSRCCVGGHLFAGEKTRYLRNTLSKRKGGKQKMKVEDAKKEVRCPSIFKGSYQSDQEGGKKGGGGP